MPMLTQDMSTVPAPGEAPPKGWYQVRVSKVEITESKNSGNQQVQLDLKIQQPDSGFVGRPLRDFLSLQPHALLKLKAYYKAVGYNPGPEGHDPDKLLDAELWVYGEPEVYQGQTLFKIAPWSIRNITEGPGQMPKSA